MKWQKWHRILAWMAGLQMILWLITGLTLSLLPADLLNDSKDRVRSSPNVIATPLPDLTPLLREHGDKLLGVDVAHHLPQAVYQVKTTEGNHWYRIKPLAPFTPTMAELTWVAAASYSGSAPLSRPELITSPAQSISSTPVYLVTAGDTQIYIDAASARVIAHKHAGSQIKQWLLMIHFMDYFPDNGLGFNALPIQIMALLALTIGLSGVATLISRGLAGTLVLPFNLAGSKTLEVFDLENRPLAEFKCRGSLLQSINHKQKTLTTRCGGGGSCGMCRLRWLEDAPEPTKQDRFALSEAMLAEGVRLGCQHKAGNMKVALSTPAQQKYWQRQTYDDTHPATKD
ncbi:2Fe-2S iron-sulfur cluster-binding protein [Shewanella corallii]|uniref:2Fe-2S iron-sulfur cluster-binding protein n=1 Tax=Shewanella corallii TaxID=560080 RepID=A0ABT0ND49_9GAMM|nr:2Fe-2S iron-sulfur cluster-binding protein [Shewanella corallii]MCL2916391.1 2Fe-2S iron-sulfur cluster-binding protein [Shewanella corallii]